MATRKWHFVLHLQEKLTEEQADTIDGLDRFTDGRISRVESPGHTEFSCLFAAEVLTDAIAEALGLFEDFPGVLVKSVELDWVALDVNGMATPAVVPAPPPL
ncbi:hypothetical protein [Streptomyces clavuligerus]|uniref:DUF4242 domain-containing protein n=1 Tax=Streptomyces clavuligerus TaxID=1901 RepID=B5GND3_STRCL|nr:hypothetical protein [Streptomyces clavuligerus]EDY47829.1 hypothetical protein SSCG_00857 [Streptomyces clavuligerus]EFG04185.1 Hypothetical protein SCLAV_p0698 [Streptomyces clavuligerus]MBY6307334.1 hypothetical protein [Streptomyces clavuligerus]QPJ97857.1 hypothetical protein GE265_32970 [Streptomyces clavuligerus]WDN56806.1 hypothetical protein LL058_33920 [Streptomyces clavuligerus]